jgi:mannose-6-phosphate isomerase-like protein (cupin superfamily)
MLQKVNLQEALGRFTEHWRPKVIGALNGQEVKVVKLAGAFVWHHHAEADELFLVLRGRLRIELRDGAVTLDPGEMVIVPRGVEHRPVADGEGEVAVLLFEPAGVRNTGNVEHPELTAPDGERL